jgi:hypothetical protein
MNAATNSELKANCISNNREIIVKRAVWDDNMRQIEEEYESLIKSYKNR